MGCAEAEKLAVEWRGTGFPVRLAWWGAVAAALLPIAPTPLPAVDRPVPRFITSGAWRPYVAGGHTLVPLPLPRNTFVEGMQWSAVTNIGFQMPGGYFLGPTSETNRKANWTSPARPTSDLLVRVFPYTVPATVTADDRAHAIDDLRFWRAGVLVFAPRVRKPGMPPPRREAAFRETVTKLTGVAAQWTGGVWIWDVRSITGPVS
jgi:hypothetical protein